ncbi:MAG: SDR family NAD(P)-dependent oxidoreductase [Planctomycetota bacterium]
MGERLDSVVLTGASSGIGEAAALRLARRCDRLVLVARRAERMGALAKRIEAESGGVAVEVLAADLGDAPARGAVARRVGQLSRAGRLALVNNAGRGQYRAMSGLSEADHRGMLEVNYFAAAELMAAALPGMAAHGWGRVVNVASVAAQGPPWGHGAYTASKAALSALGATLDGEHRRGGVDGGVRVSTLYPGVVASEFFDSGDYARLWPRIAKHAIACETVGRSIERLIDRPRVELTVPRHFRVMSWLRLINAEWGHRTVMASSRPPTGASATTDDEPAATATGLSPEGAGR